jgi:hypothetical protein
MPLSLMVAAGLLRSAISFFVTSGRISIWLPLRRTLVRLVFLRSKFTIEKIQPV